MVSKTGSSSISLLTLDFLTQKIHLLESIIHNELAPVAQLKNLIPTDTPPVHTGVQGGEGIGVGMGMASKISMGGSGSSKGDDDAKVVGKVISTQLHTSLLKTSFTTTSTTTPKGPLTKGVVIDSGVGGSSSSKPPPSTEELKNKGKGIST